MKKLFAAVLAGLFVVLFATPAYAWRVPRASTIEADFETASTGDAITFTVLVNGPVAPRGYVYIDLKCFQNGYEIFHDTRRDFYEPFVLTPENGYYGDGFPARCLASLVYVIDRKIYPDKVWTLDSVYFDVDVA